MSNQRVSGQDTEVTIVVDSAPVLNITAIKSFTVTWKFSTKSEEYIGETGPRKDDFFEGLSGTIDFDMEGNEALLLVDAIKTRAQNRRSNTKIGIKTMLQFPDGDRAIINIPQVFFGDVPMAFAGRTEYGKMTLTFEAENGRIVSR